MKYPFHSSMIDWRGTWLVKCFPTFIRKAHDTYIRQKEKGKKMQQHKHPILSLWNWICSFPHERLTIIWPFMAVDREWNQIVLWLDGSYPTPTVDGDDDDETSHFFFVPLFVVLYSWFWLMGRESTHLLIDGCRFTNRVYWLFGRFWFVFA